MIAVEDILLSIENGNPKCGLWGSENEDGEDLIVQISKDKLKITTLQNNDWLRINTWHWDSENREWTVEESYER